MAMLLRLWLLCLWCDGLSRSVPRMHVVDRRFVSSLRPIQPSLSSGAPRGEVRPSRGASSNSSAVSLRNIQLTLSTASTSADEPAWISHALWGLGSSGSETWRNASIQQAANDLLCRLLEQRETASAVQISKAFVGLARMQARWSSPNLPSPSLVLLCEKAVGDLESQGLANVMWSLGTMEAPIGAFPLRLKLGFLSTLRRVSSDFTDQGISSTLWGLSKLQTSWDELPMNSRSVICSVICRLCCRMSGCSKDIFLK